MATRTTTYMICDMPADHHGGDDNVPARWPTFLSVLSEAGMSAPRTVELDLCDDCMANFAQPLITVGRKARPHGMAAQLAVAPRAKGRRRPEAETQAIRAWAKAEGFDISERGRIPGTVEVAYRAAVSVSQVGRLQATG